MQNTNTTPPELVASPPYPQAWIARRYGLSAVVAGEIARLAFPGAVALAEADPKASSPRGRR